MPSNGELPIAKRPLRHGAWCVNLHQVPVCEQLAIAVDVDGAKDSLVRVLI
jgi:hypothetical protein